MTRQRKDENISQEPKEMKSVQESSKEYIIERKRVKETNSDEDRERDQLRKYYEKEVT